jgi:hypothetical protein
VKPTNPRWRRCLKRFGIALGLIVVACAVPILWNETQCVGSLPPAPSSYRPILPAEHRRNLVDTYLTYPEWSIVHAYEDFAGVTRQHGEPGFRYFESIAGYWRSLCGVSAIASSKGTITADVKAMLYIIGISFSGEMGVKGAYELTIGRLTEWIRGTRRTPEDAFALSVADDYAAFLRQTPWYEFPFWQTLVRFWHETPLSTPSVIRSVERRLALSMEYGVKAIYARVIALAAAAAPAALTIRSVISGIDKSDVAAGGHIKLIERRPDGTAVIETPRYRAFTDILRAQIERGRSFLEIAGNDEIFITALARREANLTSTMARELVNVPLQARPGWTRRGLAVSVRNLPAIMQSLRQAGAEFEHAYDY